MSMTGRAGIDYSFNAILGCGGSDLWKENAVATAALINAVQPHLETGYDRGSTENA